MSEVGLAHLTLLSRLSQQDHGAHEDVEELVGPPLLTLPVLTKGAADFFQSLHWVTYGK